MHFASVRPQLALRRAVACRVRAVRGNGNVSGAATVNGAPGMGVAQSVNGMHGSGDGASTGGHAQLSHSDGLLAGVQPPLPPRHDDADIGTVAANLDGVLPLAQPRAPSPPSARVTLSDITQAGFRIHRRISQTPCEESLRMSKLLGAQVFFKREFVHRTGSFKERGAANVLLQLTPEQRANGVCCASAGNHALAVAYHGQRLGIPVSVVMPTVAPLTKVKNCRKFGANVIVEGDHLLESREVASQLEKEHNMLYINGYDDPGIIAGQGTVGTEILNQVQDLDAVVVPVGGGGLIAGMALSIKALNPSVQVIGVESECCASWQAALAAGEPVPFDMRGRSTLADGLAVTTVGANAFNLAKDLIDKVVTVSESSIALAVLRLLEEERCVVEGGGATGVAGFLDGKLNHLHGKRVAVVLCGGNIDTPVLGRVIERGLAVDGRLHRFTARCSDRPGGIHALTKILAEAGASVKDIMHERAWVKEDIAMVAITVSIETRDALHAMEVRQTLKDASVEFDWHSGSTVI